MTYEEFVAEHGPVVQWGDGPDGPSYVGADGWMLFCPLDGSEPEAAVNLDAELHNADWITKESA